MFIASATTLHFPAHYGRQKTLRSSRAQISFFSRGLNISPPRGLEHSGLVTGRLFVFIPLLLAVQVQRQGKLNSWVPHG
jgi:hypothetical protein